MESTSELWTRQASSCTQVSPSMCDGAVKSLESLPNMPGRVEPLFSIFADFQFCIGHRSKVIGKAFLCSESHIEEEESSLEVDTSPTRETCFLLLYERRPDLGSISHTTVSRQTA